MDINQLTRIFYDIGDFCKGLNQYAMEGLLPSHTRGQRGPAGCLSESEIIMLLIFFQSSGWRNFKTFYIHFVSIYWKKELPKLTSYHRFLELVHRVLLHLTLFAQFNSGKRSGLYYIDSTCLPVCHLKRSRRHKTFDNMATYGRTSIG